MFNRLRTCALCKISYYHKMSTKHIIDQNLSICHLELLNIVIAVKTWPPHGPLSMLELYASTRSTSQVYKMPEAGTDSCYSALARSGCYQLYINLRSSPSTCPPGQLMTHADALSCVHLNPSLTTKISTSTQRRVSLKWTLLMSIIMRVN